MREFGCVTIPSDHVDSVTETVLGVLAAHAEAVSTAAQAYLEGEEELGEVEHARAELRAVEDVLSDLGWPRGPATGPVEIVGPPRLLRELIRAALLDAANGVVATVSRYEAGREELPAVRRAVSAVPPLYELFAGFEAGHAAACERGTDGDEGV